MKKTIILWIIAIFVTLSFSVYQRITGPTHPKKVEITLNEKQHKFKLLRSHGGKTDAPIELDVNDGLVSAKLYYKCFPSKKDEEWKVIDFEKVDTKLISYLPNQQMAGKLMYYMSFYTEKGIVNLQKEKPIIIRFKGAVPSYILIPHIFFMFFTILFANVAGLFAIANIPKYRLYTYLTFIFLLIGGMILGPIVQKFAFDEYWAGIPFAWDLTDNKTLFAFVFWIIAVVGNLKKDRKYLTIMASIAILIIFFIPHSMYGSELNRETGDVIQGFINLLYLF